MDRAGVGYGPGSEWDVGRQGRVIVCRGRWVASERSTMRKFAKWLAMSSTKMWTLGHEIKELTKELSQYLNCKIRIR
jgi:hypothetical protein